MGFPFRRGWKRSWNREGEAGAVRTVLKVVFWMAVAVLVASLVLTVAGSVFNREPVLAAGTLGWFLGCLLLFAWSILLAVAWVRSRGAGRGKGERGSNAARWH